jgi:hypothetical protein
VARLAVLAFVLALAGCAGPAVKPPAEALITRTGDVVTYRGPIGANSYAALMTVVGSAPVRTLQIRSGGGEVGNAIDIARWVHRNGVAVVVDGACFSSCSNYIFPVGREKHIVAGGIVGWHGTIEHLLYKQKTAATPDPNLDAIAAMAARERAFYAEVGLNGYLSWFGKIAPYNTPNLYFLSEQDMAWFGLSKLHVRADYLATDLKILNAADKDTIRLLTIDRSVTNPADPNWISFPPP